MRDMVRHIQNARKNAGLQVEDRIHVSVRSEDALVRAALEVHAQTIKAETLALNLQQEIKFTHTETVKINGAPAIIALKKAV